MASLQLEAYDYYPGAITVVFTDAERETMVEPTPISTLSPSTILFLLL